MLAFAFPYRRFSRALAVAALALAMGACVAVQVPKLPQDALPAHWRNAPKLGAKPDLTGWWKHFHDPQLNALVMRALKDSPSIAQAVSNLRAARALEEASGAKFTPSLAFRTREQTNAANTASYFQAGFDATWELGLFGRRAANGHIAGANAGAAAADLQSARVSLVAEVVREYLGLRAAQRSAALLQRAAHAARKKVHLLQILERLQLASRLQLTQAVSAASNAEARLADPRAAIASHAQTLALLLGQSEPEPAWLKSAPLPHLESANVVSLPANLLRTRPDIRYAETQVLKAAGEVGIAKANMYPQLSLGGGVTFSAKILGHAQLGDFNGITGIAPFITIPLFHWGRRLAVRDARADQLEAALAGYRKTVLKDAAQVETSLASLHAAGQRLKHADAAAAASQQGLALDEKLQTLGQADQMNLADGEQALSQARLARVQARLERALAFVALYKALGGAPLPPPSAPSAKSPHAAANVNDP
jgi:NodT family efflux transporter outer membrane factor (OMF) lipoprotein